MSEILKKLLNSADGMSIYEHIVNEAEGEIEGLDELVARLKEVDLTGQFLSSTARFLGAVDRQRYSSVIGSLVEGAIDRDKDRRYIGSLLEAIWGPGYEEKAEELKISDDNFRRIYKRIYERDVVGK